MWGVVTGQRSAAASLYTLIDEGAGESAINGVLAERDRKGGKYYFLEDQLNAYGYRFLQQDKVKGAITLFRLNVNLFPASWNVYDSLGEALLKDGDAEAAIKMYEKSLELNPESKSGKDALARIRGAAQAK